jgi:hypothetical protein
MQYTSYHLRLVKDEGLRADSTIIRSILYRIVAHSRTACLIQNRHTPALLGRT